MLTNDKGLGTIEFRRPTLTEAFLGTAHSLSFPVLSLKFVPVQENSDSIAEIKIPAKLYETIKQTYLINEITLALPLGGPIAVWTYDMIIAIHILSTLNIVDDLRNWIITAQSTIVKVVSNEKIKPKKASSEVLRMTGDILHDLGLLIAVGENKLLSSTMRDLIREKRIDTDTLVYKFALAIYHTGPMSGIPILPALEDEVELYVMLIQSEFYEKNQNKFREMMELPLEARRKTLKIFLAFVIAAYLYYKERIQSNE